MIRMGLAVGGIVCLLVLSGCLGVGGVDRTPTDTSPADASSTPEGSPAAHSTPAPAATDTDHVRRAVAFVEDYRLRSAANRTADDGNATASGPDTVMRFRYVENTSAIPWPESNVTRMSVYPGVDPAETVERGDGTATVQLTTWSRVNGVLTNWTVTVADDGTVTRATGVAQDTQVGDYRLVWEGIATPLPGEEYISLGRAKLSGESGSNR
ncbi:hypothetical protein ACOZ4N_04910 [Halorientalis pallida]|uniref:hypothetical protein n=1 Tax=Halorientalis pallida TaxID=2479928 RepID=UPI003C703D1E